MKKDWGRTARFALLASVISLAGGCATTSGVDTADAESLRAMVEEAKQAAEEARAAAERAQATADKALRTAEGASQCCQDTNEKIDRMFKRSMYK